MGMLADTGLLAKGLKAEFIQQFASEATLLDKLATVVPSNSDGETYAWLGESPTMSEFVDTRQIKGFSDTTYTITNKTWEATMAVLRSELEDDNTGSIRLRVQQLAQKARRHVNKLLVDALINGTTDLCYDGTAYFGNSHTARGEQSSAQDNLLAGSGTTVAALKTDVQAAMAAMMNFVDERGEPFWEDFNPSEFVAVVPPGIFHNFREAIEATVISNTTNTMSGSIGQVLPAARLSDADDWYLLYTGGVVRPLIFQDRMGMEFTALEGDTETAFKNERYLYGVRARYNVGYGFWQFGVKTTN